MINLPTHKMNNISGVQFEEAIASVNNIPAPEFDEDKYYIYGDYVMHDFKLYMCIDDEGFIPGPWDATQWEQHRVFDNSTVIVDSNEAPEDDTIFEHGLTTGTVFSVDGLTGELILE